jgi:hypothetical protein
MQMTRYYEVKPNPELTALWDKIQADNKSFHLEAREFAKKIGATHCRANREEGWIFGFTFPEKPDPKVYSYDKKLGGYNLKKFKFNKDLIAESSSLTKVSYKPLLAFIHFESFIDEKTMIFHNSPEMFQAKDGSMAIAGPDSDHWKAPEFCIPITWERYKELEKKEGK